MQGSPRIDELRQKFHENPRRYFAPLANEYRKAGDPEQAIAICRAHLAQQPGHMSGHVVYGQALYDAKRPDEARAVFEKALSLDPDNTVVLRQLGDIAREKGDTLEARHWYGKALDLDPQDTESAAYIAELAEPLMDDAAKTAESATPEVVDASPAGTAEATRAETVETPRTETVEPGPVAEAKADATPPAAPAEAQGDGAGVDEEPQVAADESSGDEPDAEEKAGVTPHPEESPFVTRTMADLYARQGYDSAALDVYRQLAIRHPEDQAIRDRIAELSIAPEPEPETEAVRESETETEAERESETETERERGPETEMESEPETVASAETGKAAEAGPTNEPAGISGLEPIYGIERNDFAELSDEPMFAPSSEDLNLAPPPATPSEPPSGSEAHFTEVELSAGDAWDSDAWGAGFTLDENIIPEFDRPDAGSIAEVDPALPGSGLEISVDEAGMASTSPSELELAPPSGDDVEEMHEPTSLRSESDDAAIVAEDEAAAAMVGDREPLEAGEAAADAAGEETGVVAYSPEPPRAENLAHFTPRPPTVREFFATLGARRPASSASTESQPAQSQQSQSQPAQSQSAQQADVPQPASDAFSGLFADSPVSEEDTRAAFAMSAALSSTAHTPAPSTVQTSPPRPSPAVNVPDQESEEDIRRFREWLDGLAES